MPRVPAPTVLRITRLLSRPGLGATLVERCASIGTRETTLHPNEFVVHQARRLRSGDRTEVVSITLWHDMEHVRRHMPPRPGPEPPFFEEYEDLVESWNVELLEVTYTSANGGS
jgi:hypothetical protein